MWRYSALSVARDSSASEPASSTPGRSATDHDEGRQRLHFLRIGAGLGPVEGLEDAAADLQRVRQRLQHGGVLGPFVVAEPGVDRPGRQDEVIVVDRAGIADADLALHLVDPFDLAEHHRDVLVRAEQRADRRGDVGRRQRRGRDLVEQRLEEVVVGAVDQHELDVELGDVHRRLQAAETAADDGNDRLPGLLAGEQDGLRSRSAWLAPRGCGRIAARHLSMRRRRADQRARIGMRRIAPRLHHSGYGVLRSRSIFLCAMCKGNVRANSPGQA